MQEMVIYSGIEKFFSDGEFYGGKEFEVLFKSGV